jgi:hypothetical protein
VIHHLKNTYLLCVCFIIVLIIDGKGAPSWNRIFFIHLKWNEPFHGQV